VFAAACVAVAAAVASPHRLPLTHRPVPTPLREDLPALRSEIADTVNAAGTTWTASADQGRSAISGKSLGEVRRMMGVLPGGKRAERKTEFDVELKALPTSFDSRQQWPQCTEISRIRDQSACGSCWAFGAVEAMSDRNCIFLKKNLSLSTEDMVACCSSCGDGCGGGYPDAAWDYWVKTGLVTDTCSPYTLPSCDHHLPNSTHPCPSNEYPTPKCVKKCNDSESWSTALHYGSKSYSVSGPANYQQEMYTNGPFEVAFDVYEDFLTYKSGVYSHTTGSFLGGHAVKALGWGVLNGTPYWLIANSWNPDWGMNGYFLIKRGNNECGIETSGSAGVPKN